MHTATLPAPTRDPAGAPPRPDAIIRTVKDRQHPYTQIVNRVLTDDRLSWEARGMLAYLLSKPDDWQVRFSDLRRQGGRGRDSTQRILKELAAAGYRVRVCRHLADGRWYWESHIYEQPP